MGKFAKFKLGKAPGTLAYIGEAKTATVSINLLRYDKENIVEATENSLEQLLQNRKKLKNKWININGLHNATLIEELRKKYEIHPLILEDCIDTQQRPKLESIESHLFAVVKMATVNEHTSTLELEQISLILGKDYLITLQEKEGDVFKILRERIHNTAWRERALETDYLFYALLDTIVDHYFLVLETLTEKAEALEEQILESPSKEVLKNIHHLKSESRRLRRAIWPTREIASSLLRDELKYFKKETFPYLHDLYDHIIQVGDLLDSLREKLSSLLETYLSGVSNKMNEVMKVLTLFAAIFIPLTFVVGIYGMNFRFMPELEWKYSYPLLWIIMILIAAGMLLLFKRKKWL
ncbi:MAG: magnesium and cobalt transport protein CorA [Deltaproteobacteria bacterium CG_4_10_14_0_2_um_filter_43_8]|nr:MAG: magnesium and cobalt transport protein CorA [Deltaproteobacteria bacterium CG11_big_fil_rev_8_21_14_0_20_42_23]PJA18845.1 MAG: magnesium and cobalt transport protein CorA [Deltaproteobacteria bacterium CG_4_10_14_0_2_um_filter_43_8]PJC64772.1 MAG: magnesium and cobalt transport protein CorA [Deltaproteobacteria bacterium CG_4_9_14_0_2_um_filter_42_21]